MRKRNKISKLRRHQEIYSLLRRRNEESALSISDVHKELETRLGERLTRKTVARDLEEMSETHRLLQTENYPTRFYASEGFSVDYALNFSEEQLQIIVLALENLGHTSPKYLQTVCAETETTLLSKLPRALSTELTRFKNMHHFSYGINGRAIAKDDAAFGLVLKALRNGRAFSCKYISPYREFSYQERTRRFGPLLFQMTGGIPFLYVKDLDDNQNKNLRVTRIVDVSILNITVEPFNKNEIPGVEFFFGGYGGAAVPIVEFRIVANKKVATYFDERQIHPSQVIEDLGNDRFRVTFKLVKTDEINRLVKGFGSDVDSFECVPI